jgi:ABC-2 type transport system permease protein
MFGKVAAFELRYQLKSPVFWVSAVIVFLLTFGSVTVDTIQIGSTSNVHVNAPAAILNVTLVFSLFFMFLSTALVANVVVRDDDTGFGPIIRATRISKFDYLYGRFLGAFAAVALAFVAVPLGVLAGSVMPWLDPEKVGPFRPLDYLYAYVVFALPSLFVISAAFFALAAATRSMIAGYVGVVGFLVLYVVALALAAKPEFRTLMAYLEPFGFGAVGAATRYWTASERNSMLPPRVGALLWNRLLWSGLGLGSLAGAYGLFRFEPVSKTRRSRAAAREALEGGAPVGSTALPPPIKPSGTGAGGGRTFGFQSLLAQFVARTRFDMAQVFKSPAFFVLLSLGVFNAGAGLWFTVTDGLYGDNIYPVTREMITVARGAFGFIPLIVAIYYAGELVWRERDRKTEELIDVTPAPDWVFVAPKIAAISLVLLSMLAVSILTGLAVQLLRGFTHIEFGKYIGWYLLPEAVDFILLAILAVFLQTLAPQKYIGWGLMVLVIVSQIVMSKVGLEDNLYQYGAGPDVPLSDMNGLGVAGVARAWFRAYWSATALALAVLTYGLWRRGAGSALRPRLARLPHRLAGPAGGVLALGLVAAIALGGFIFLNTHVWNNYRTELSDERYKADYEKALLPFEKIPQPKIIDVKLAIDLYPDQPAAITHGVYTFQNKTLGPIKTLHVRFDRDLVVRSLSVDGARPLKTYDRFNYRIFAFDTPMAPGELRKLSFTTWRGQHGFKNADNTGARIYHNGTFVTNDLLTPALGMDRSGLLEDRAKRRKYGLAPELRMPKLEDEAARQFNALRKDADWVTSDITVSTVADQTPIAPGYRVADRVAAGRHISEFRTEAPVNMFFSVQSAKYTVRRETYKGVDLAIYYDAQHPWNVDRMTAALKVGLDYDQANFSPYQFRQMRILEFPDYAEFAQSFANTIPYSEGIGFIIDARDPAKIDMVTYVTAHELGHQWWAHQVIGANMQGSAMLSETFAQYAALMAMKHLYGPDQIRKFLKYELDNYLRARGGEAAEELPLERVEDQSYIYYRKGSLVMYRLQDEIGEAPVNRALRKLIHAYAFKAAPYPTSKDFIADLRAEAGPDKQQLITDLFEKITLYDLKAVKATSKRRADGRYDVTLQVSGGKLYADGKGSEASAPLNEAFDIGLFAKEPGRAAFTSKDVILLQHLPIHSGQQTLRFTVDRAPVFAGVDPYNKAIDRNSEDNIARVGG